MCPSLDEYIVSQILRFVNTLIEFFFAILSAATFQQMVAVGSHLYPATIGLRAEDSNEKVLHRSHGLRSYSPLLSLSFVSLLYHIVWGLSRGNFQFPKIFFAAWELSIPS